MVIHDADIPEMPRTFEDDLRSLALDHFRHSGNFQQGAARCHQVATNGYSNRYHAEAQERQAFLHAKSVKLREFGQFLLMLADLEAQRKASMELQIEMLKAAQKGLVRIISPVELVQMALEGRGAEEGESSHVTKH